MIQYTIPLENPQRGVGAAQGQLPITTRPDAVPWIPRQNTSPSESVG